jgi:TrmH family RNA methyltransferase
VSVITSRANARVKAIRALARGRRQRDATGLFFAEGERLLRMAIEAGAAIETLVAVPERLDAGGREVVAKVVGGGAELLEVTAFVFDSLSFREEPSSMGAVIRQRRDTLADAAGRPGPWVALTEVRHPGNLGTVVRTCDGAGGSGVVLLGPGTDPWHPVAVRGSLGAAFSQAIVRAEWEEFAAWVREGGRFLAGTSPAGAIDFREVEYRAPTVVLMGGERAGLSEAQLAACDVVVRIPMLGRVDSLNLPVAAALVLYEVQRQLGPRRR